MNSQHLPAETGYLRQLPIVFGLIVRLVGLVPFSVNSQDAAAAEPAVSSGVLTPEAAQLPRVNVDGRDVILYGEEKNFRYCDEACLRASSNESITQQYLYLEAKYNQVQAAGPGDEAVVRGLLGNFCADAESFQQCQVRYLDFVSFRLLKIRSALRSNDTQAAQLRCARWVGSDCVEQLSDRHELIAHPVSDQWAQSEAKKAPRDSHLVSGSELLALAEAHEAQWSALPQKEQENWLGHLDELEPKPEDFARFKKVARNSQDPSQGYFQIAQVDVRGKIQYDQAAYERALTAWRGFKPQITQSALGRENSGIAQRKKALERFRTEFRDEREKASAANDHHQRKLFTLTRSQYLLGLQQFSDEHRKPKPQPTPNPSSGMIPAVSATPRANAARALAQLRPNSNPQAIEMTGNETLKVPSGSSSAINIEFGGQQIGIGASARVPGSDPITVVDPEVSRSTQEQINLWF